MVCVTNHENYPLSFDLTQFNKDKSVDKRYGQRTLVLEQGKNEVDDTDLGLLKKSKSAKPLIDNGKIEIDEIAAADDGEE